jgi:hypothetical protein
MGNKFDTAPETGPQGEKNVAAGDYTRTISFKVNTINGTSAAGGNIAFKKQVTFSSQQEGNEASNLVDGGVTTKWSAETYPQWVQIDLGQNYSIDKTELIPFQDRAYQYRIEVSTDGVNYSQVVDRTANTQGGSLLTDAFDAVTTRYVRLTVTGASNYGGGWVSLNEFRVFESVNLALNKTVTFSSQQEGSEASKVVDGNAETKWSAETYPQWVQIDLGQPTSIGRTALAPHQNRAYQYKVDVSTDGVNYTQVVDRTANTQGGSLLSDTFSSVTARYVRLTITGASNYGGGWVSINEFGVYDVHKKVEPDKETSTELSAVGPVSGGQQFSLNYSLKNVNTAIYGQDITFEFDSNQLEFVEAQSLIEGIQIINTPTPTNGKVKILLLSLENNTGISEDSEVLKLTWRAKAALVDTVAKIQLTRAKLSDIDSNVTEANASSVDVNIIGGPDKTVLIDKIAEAQQLHDQAIEGNGPGQYYAGSKARLLASLNAAKAVESDLTATSQQITEAIAALSEALKLFRATSGDVTDNGQVDIGDLVRAAKHYGKSSSSNDWSTARFVDVNMDNKIDIEDIVLISNKILSE